MSTRSKVAELDIARKAMRHGLKRDFATAKQEVAPGALIGQIKARTKGQIEQKAQIAAGLIADNRKPLALGGLVALATSLIAYSARRWKKRRPPRNPAEPFPLPTQFDGETE